MVLLGYVLQDGRDLEELCLLPLLDGRFAKVSSCAENITQLYLPSREFPARLLPTLTESLIDIDCMDEEVFNGLKKKAQQGTKYISNPL